MPRGKRVKKLNPNTIEGKCAWTLGVEGSTPSKNKMHVSLKTALRDVVWVANRAQDYTFKEFYKSISDVAIKLGKTEEERQEYLKKLFNLISKEAEAIYTEVDAIKDYKRMIIRKKAGASF